MPVQTDDPFSASPFRTSFDPRRLLETSRFLRPTALGITGASLAAVRLQLASLPDGVTWRPLHGCAWFAGIGFTMSLFIATLAFEGTALLDAAKTESSVGRSFQASSDGWLSAGAWLRARNLDVDIVSQYVAFSAHDHSHTTLSTTPRPGVISLA